MEEKPSVLLVDDSATSRASLARLLKAEEFVLRLAVSGEEALQQVQEWLPDVILLDVVMPGLDGFEICRRLKSTAQWRHIPVILITALSSTDDVVLGLEAGADEFLSKPVHGPILRARVRSMLRLKYQYDELKETLQLREDLANMAAHDLRSPLSAAALYAHLLLKKEPRGDQQHYLEAIESQIRRANALVNDMLLLAKTERRKLQPNLAPVDLQKVLYEALQRHDVVARAKGIELKLETRAWDNGHLVLLDDKLFDRLLDNLLENALKFSPAGSEVCVELSPAEPDSSDARPQAVVTVSDQGPGIAAPERARIFDPFEVVALRAQGIQQTGLGLAFCRMVAEAHGGRIEVLENRPTGSTFRVEI